ncbi:hypothetical protein HHI36_002892 [Cryptolaemus montrouzieri]|uniref:Uncharacterized protein n=1 Tax=Cryptolaemus montrouzieri TaxID=559131 RepID=A0ABD2PCM7_9CUCU
MFSCCIQQKRKFSRNVSNDQSEENAGNVSSSMRSDPIETPTGEIRDIKKTTSANRVDSSASDKSYYSVISATKSVTSTGEDYMSTCSDNSFQSS